MDARSTTQAGPPPAILPRWAPTSAATVVLGGALAAALWAATHVHVDPVLHEVALFVHLASLVLGFGSVLAVDWVALLWLVQRRSLGDVLRTAGNAHFPIWAGYAGLVVSGVLLDPDITSQATRLKLVLVLVIGWNGLFAGALHRRMSRLRGEPGRELLMCSAASGFASQLGWWGAMLIGFANGR